MYLFCAYDLHYVNRELCCCLLCQTSAKSAGMVEGEGEAGCAGQGEGECEAEGEAAALRREAAEATGEAARLRGEVARLRAQEAERAAAVERLADENGALRARLRGVAHSPLSDSEKRQLLLAPAPRRMHSSAPASIALAHNVSPGLPLLTPYISRFCFQTLCF